MEFLYLSNSTYQASSVLGYTLVYGDQSTMESPECVNLVYPPTITIENTPTAQPSNHPPTHHLLECSTKIGFVVYFENLKPNFPVAFRNLNMN